MTVLSFENIKDKDSKGGFNPANLPLYQAHKPTTEPTFQDMLPEERVEQFGKIEEFSKSDVAIDKFKRAMNLMTNTLFGDIPYVRKALPKNIRETTPEFPKEKIIAPLVEVGRDIYGYSKASKLINLVSKGQYASKAARIIYKTGTEAIKGGFVGALTADSEDPIDIAKKAGIYGGIGAATVPAVEAISFAGSQVVKALGASKNLQSLSEWLGLSLRENKANNLVRERYGAINSRLIDSEKYLDTLSREMTKKENKALAHIVESGNLDKIADKKTRSLAKGVRKYLDKAHAELVRDYGKDISFIEDYVPHMWDIPKNKEKEVINWFITRNQHLKERRIDTIEAGIKKFGLKPKYEKITDIIRVYDQIRIKSAANIKFVNGLKELQDSSGINLIQRADKAPSSWPLIDHPAIRQSMMIGKTSVNVPVSETTKIITESLEKITTITKSGGGTVEGKAGVIARLESVMEGALESRGMTKGEAGAYIGRLRAAYSGVGGEAAEDTVKSKVNKSIKEKISRLHKKQSVDVPILSQAPVRVHPSIYPEVKAVLDDYVPGKAEKVIDTVNTFVKQAVLNLSLFHHMALTETGIATGIGKEAMKAWNPVTILKAFKNGTYKKVLQENVLAKEAVRDGLEVGAIADVEGARHLVGVLKSAEKKLNNNALALGIKATVRKPLEFNNKFLWDYLHTTYKLSAYSNLKADMIKKFPKKDPKIIGQEVAQFVNDTFGGQSWELLSKSKKWQQFSRFVLLSPDWVLSTMRQALSPFGVGATSKAGQEIRKEMGKDFWRRALVYYGGAVNILNHAYTKAYKGKGNFMWENTPGKETYLFTGYNSDGTERYVRWGKQFRELSEAIMKPAEVLGRKLSPIIRIFQHQVIPSEVWQREIIDNEVLWGSVFKDPKKYLKSLGKEAFVRSKQLLKDTTPYSISQIQRVGDLNPTSFAMPVSRGMTPYTARKLFRVAIITKDKKLFERIRLGALENKIDPDPIYKQAVAKLKSEVTFEDRREAHKIWIKMKKLDDYEKVQEYYQDLDLTPGVEKQLINIMRKYSVAVKKKRRENK